MNFPWTLNVQILYNMGLVLVMKHKFTYLMLLVFFVFFSVSSFASTPEEFYRDSQVALEEWLELKDANSDVYKERRDRFAAIMKSLSPSSKQAVIKRLIQKDYFLHRAGESCHPEVANALLTNFQNLTVGIDANVLFTQNPNNLIPIQSAIIKGCYEVSTQIEITLRSFIQSTFAFSKDAEQNTLLHLLAMYPMKDKGNNEDPYATYKKQIEDYYHRNWEAVIAYNTDECTPRELFKAHKGTMDEKNFSYIDSIFSKLEQFARDKRRNIELLNQIRANAEARTLSEEKSD